MKVIYYALSVWVAITLSGCVHSAKEDGLGHDHSHHGHEQHDKHAHEKEKEHEHEHEHGHAHKHAHQEKNNNHSDEIVLKPEDAQRFGVLAQKVTPQQFNEVIKVSGQIVPAPGDQSVVAAPSSGIITFASNINEGKKISAGTFVASISSKGITGGDPNEAARIALDAAKRELDRATPLHADGIISTKDFNAIKQAYDQARAAYTGSASGSSAVASTSGVITKLYVQQGEYVTAGQPIASISRNSRLTLRADLPEKHYNFIPTISSANFRTAYSDSVISLSKINGKLITSSTVTSTEQPGYIPVYFSFDNDGNAIPGTFAEIYLIGAPRQGIIALPVDAVTEQQGKYYVYVKLDDECYEKRLVTLGNSNGSEIEIRSGLSNNDVVVYHGAIIVKLAESNGAIPEGHSHNH